MPLSALASYQEGAELKLFCAANAPAHAGRVHIEWLKDGAPMSSVGIAASRAHISMMDDSSGALRVAHLRAEDAGNYTCVARNQLGRDASTVRVNVRGKQYPLHHQFLHTRAPLESSTPLTSHKLTT